MTDQTSDTSTAAGKHDRDLSRRGVLRGATVGGLALPLLAACASNEPGVQGTSESAAPSPDASASEGGGAAGGGVMVPVADVPVGGGTIIAADKLVVTQPEKGQFKAFDSTCTHQGCPVREVAGAEIRCPCHNSVFSITDGAPVSGPASAPLAPKKVTVDGDQLSIT